MTLEVLKNAPGKDELSRASVAHYQLLRAQRLYQRGQEEAALATLSGALLLLDEKSWRETALQGTGEVLLLAADQAAARGDAGRAGALYQLAAPHVKSEEDANDIAGHLAAIAQYRKETRSPIELVALGEDARNALEAAMVDPSSESYHHAISRVTTWIKSAGSSTILERGPETSLERDEAIEAYRGLRTGAPSLLALSLRQNDLKGGLLVLENEHLERTLPARAQTVMQKAVDDDESEAWLQIHGLFNGLRSEEDSEYSFQKNLALAAVFRSSWALYQSDKQSLGAALYLAEALSELGMPEVATLLLAGRAHEKSETEYLGRAVRLLMAGLVQLAESDQLPLARLSFEYGAPLTQLAAKHDDLRGMVAATYAIFAELELRKGNTTEALPLLTGALEHGAPAQLLVRKAEVLAQLKQPKEALAALKEALSQAEASNDEFFLAEVEERRYLIERSQNQADAAQLRAALVHARTARSMSQGSKKALDAARLYARMTQYFDSQAEVRDAFEQAVELAQTQDQNEVVLTEMARAALIGGDVVLARKATELAKEAHLRADALVYIALWQMACERRTQSPPDGSAQQLLAEAATQAKNWPADLILFADGKINADELKSRARDQAEETEALFYRALFEASDSQTSLLQSVAESSSLSLQEVMIARELIVNEKLPFTTK